MRRHYFGRGATVLAPVPLQQAVVLVERPAPAPAPVAPTPAPPQTEADGRAVLFGPEVARLLGISLATFHQRRKSGTFPIPETTPRLDRKPRFYREHVYAYLRGELLVLRGGRR
jgi:predicted DNA-binding transcriptional regulator AlpA